MWSGSQDWVSGFAWGFIASIVVGFIIYYIVGVWT